MAVATLALIVALAGTAFAGPVAQLARLVSGDKLVKKQSLSGNRLRNHTLSGAQIDLAKLGTVPSASQANNARYAATSGSAGSAGTANTANTASSATTANTANSANTANLANTASALTPPEGWHEVGAAGEPSFENGWAEIVGSPPPAPETVGFYKDQEGIVHLKGSALGGKNVQSMFKLPPGYRPASGKVLSFATACTACGNLSSGSTTSSYTGELTIFGPGTAPSVDGAVVMQSEMTGSKQVSFDGIAFRAAS
jgi:hypothetical protein